MATKNLITHFSVVLFIHRTLTKSRCILTKPQDLVYLEYYQLVFVKQTKCIVVSQNSNMQRKWYFTLYS